MNGTATTNELAQACCRTKSAILKSLRVLRSERAIHTAGWKSVGQPANGTVAPVYGLGDKPNAPAPAGTSASKMFQGANK